MTAKSSGKKATKAKKTAKRAAKKSAGAAKKTAAKKTAAKKSAAKKTAAKKTAAKKTAAKKTAAKKTAAKKATRRKPATKKSAAKKTATTKRAVVASSGWSTEGGWKLAVPGARLRERPFRRDPGRSAKLDQIAFGRAPPADPVKAIEVLATRVDDANAGKIPKRKLDVAVASAWGDRVCAALGWQIVELRDRGGGVVVNVLVSPDRRYCIDLRTYARRVLRLGPGAGANTLQLLFSMLRDGSRLPAVPAGSYAELG